MVVDEGQTLRNFIVGASNRRAVQRIQRSLRARPSQIVLLGASGVGKTHLLNAVANRLRARRKRVLVLRAHEFYEKYLASIYAGTVTELRSWLRSHDALIVDELEDLMTYDSALAELGRLVMAYAEARRPVYVATLKLWPVMLDQLAGWDASILPIRTPSLAQRAVAVAQRARRRMPHARLVELARTAATIPAAWAALERELFAIETGAVSTGQV